MDWFTVDKAGLAKILARKGKSFAIFELIQNGWDTNAKLLGITIKPVENRPCVDVEVIDDDPEGFKTLSHAFTLFAESDKKSDPTKRGRFNLGEKLVLALCESASISSTRGSVIFDAQGRRETRSHIMRGSIFRGRMKMTRDEMDQVLRDVQTVLPPHGVSTVLNGQTLPTRPVLQSLEVDLPTEISDADGALRKTIRKTLVTLHDVLEGETPSLYEMGIPVVPLTGGERWHVNVCVAPETKILTADLRYVPADTIRPGDSLLGFDEHRVEGRRRFRLSTVLSTVTLKRPSYRLTFDDGTIVVCSAEHQWLTSWSKTRRWLTTEQLLEQSGKRAGSKIIRLLDTWETDSSYEAGYLAAALDGEGCLIQNRVSGQDWKLPVSRGYVNRIVFVQTNNEMLAQTKAFLESKRIGYAVKWRKHVSPNHRPTCEVRTASRADMLRLLGQVRPSRLLPKLDVELLGTIPTGRSAHLIRKEYLGEQTVCAIETDTSTFIAEGLASHNCQKIPLNIDRDNVTPAYMQTIRVTLAELAKGMITKEDSGQLWLTAATDDKRVSKEVVDQVLDHRFGKKRAVFDPSDIEANKALMNEGYTIIHGGSLSSGQWAHVKTHGLASPAGKLKPTGVQYSEDGRPEKVVDPSGYTPGQKRLVEYTQALALRLLFREVDVRIVSEITQPHAAWFGAGGLTFNLGRLGKAWFEQDVCDAHHRLIIHEFAHAKVDDHLTREFSDEICRLAVKLAREMYVDPDFFKKSGYRP